MKLSTLLLISSFAISAAALNYADIVFVILSQKHPYHSSLADRLKKDIINQALEDGQKKPSVVVATRRGAWAILPLLGQLAEKHSDKGKWAFFCDPHTTVRLPQLQQVLKKLDPDEETWIGHSLRDAEPTIIHHFSYSNDGTDFTYPNFASGFVLSMALLRTLHHRFQENETGSSTVFTIDPAFELAKFIWDEGEGSRLTHSDMFCVVSHAKCATYPKSYEPCGDPVPKESVYFAVKTYHKYHSTRAAIVKDTWGKFAEHFMFFSDKNDTTLPAVSLGVENTERGHCAKTIAILNFLTRELAKYPEVNWLVIADDDTILSVSRLCEVVSCYGRTQVALGERYGYNILSGGGYDYLTGGGGLVLSRDLLEPLSACACPEPHTPDDMWLGVCLARINVPVIHSPLFHQARPMDYAMEYLAPHRPVSFHKHWMMDPIQVYKQWFESDDSKFAGTVKTVRHTEL